MRHSTIVLQDIYCIYFCWDKYPVIAVIARGPARVLLFTVLLLFFCFCFFERGRKGERENLKQALCPVWSPMWGSVLQTELMTWAEIRSRKLNWLSHTGAYFIVPKVSSVGWLRWALYLGFHKGKIKVLANLGCYLEALPESPLQDLSSLFTELSSICL